MKSSHTVALGPECPRRRLTPAGRGAPLRRRHREPPGPSSRSRQATHRAQKTAAVGVNGGRSHGGPSPDAGSGLGPPRHLAALPSRASQVELKYTGAFGEAGTAVEGEGALPRVDNQAVEAEDPSLVDDSTDKVGTDFLASV